MENSWYDKIKEIDCDNEVKIVEELKDKIVGIAEHFNNRLIVLYDGVNYFSKENTNSSTLSPGARECDGFEDCHCGYLLGPFGKDGWGRTILVYDKEKMISKLIESYKEDGEEEDPDYSFYTMAIEHYEYNIVGGYMDGVPAFAIFDEDCY